MTLKEYREGLQDAKQKIIAALPKIADEIAVSTLSIIKDRSINEGIIINGKEGTEKQYSTRPISTNKFKGKSLNAAGDAYIKANASGTWSAFKKAQGRGSENVNLAYSMRMWTNIQVIQANQDGTGKFQIVVGGSDQETKDKIEANVKRFGVFLDPTAEELAIAQEVAKERLTEIIKGIR